MNLQVPLFVGFYETIFDSRYLDDIERELRYWESEGVELTPEDIDWDEIGYRNAVATKWTEEIEYQLQYLGIVTEINNPEVVSPRFYNFETDRIFADFTLAYGWKDKIGDFIAANWDAVAERVHDECGSHSGFISFLSDDLDEWCNILFGNGDKHRLNQYISKILEYYLEIGTDFDVEYAETAVLEDVETSQFCFVNDEGRAKIAALQNNE